MKRIVLLWMICTILISTVAFAEGTQVVIDGVPVNFTESSGAPFIENGRTLVPLRATMEAFGAEVGWEDETKTAVVSYGGTTVRCRIGEAAVYRNGTRIENDAAACIVNSRTYLPIRAVLEAFGAEVDWDGRVLVKSAYGAFWQSMETGGTEDPYVWDRWNRAMEALNGADYAGALQQFSALAKDFVLWNDPDSMAMLYLHMGDCAAHLGDLSTAAMCYRREAYYWTAAGKTEEPIDAQRRSKLIGASARVYAETQDPARMLLPDEAASYGGIRIGAYAEADKSIYDPNDPARFYMDTFPALTGKAHGAYLLYLPYGTEFTLYDSHIREAKKRGVMMQIALEPHGGLREVNGDDGYLVTLARQMETCGVPVILRFAGEMNDTTCEWYDPDPALYVEKFRLLAGIFRQYAPSVKLLFSPNFYPEDTIPSYYPGDAYVDYVGLSGYSIRQTETDPLKEGVDRSRYGEMLSFMQKNFGDRKPILLSEGAPTYRDRDTGEDITDFAVTQMKDFYTYTPIMCPSVIMAFYFDHDRDDWRFSLSGNERLLAQYKESMANPVYGAEPEKIAFKKWYELGSNVSVEAKAVTLAAYASYPKQEEILAVAYCVNGTELARASGIPYTATVDFAPYAGNTVTLTVKAEGAGGVLFENSMQIKVEAAAVDTAPTKSETLVVGKDTDGTVWSGLKS